MLEYTCSRSEAMCCTSDVEIIFLLMFLEEQQMQVRLEENHFSVVDTQLLHHHILVIEKDELKVKNHETFVSMVDH